MGNPVLSIVVSKISSNYRDIFCLSILVFSAFNSSWYFWIFLACFIKRATIKTPYAQPETELPDGQ